MSASWSTNLDRTTALLSEISADYAPAVLASALGPESMVMLDLIVAHDFNIEVMTLDTGRLPKETHALLQSVVSRYGPVVRVVYPDAEEIGTWVQKHGPNAFYQSIDRRMECCAIRKSTPLKRRVLEGKKAWLSGLRKEQSQARANIEECAWDDEHHLYKFNPMADWTADEVWGYIHAYSVPYNKLLDQGYKSVGCAPCSRAIKPGEDERAGRWWWERDTLKECGLHLDPRSGTLKRDLDG